MRISDWSSDVGSSDLGGVDEVRRQQDARVGKTEVGRHAASERARVAADEDVAVDIGRDRGHADDVAGIVHREVEKLDLILERLVEQQILLAFLDRKSTRLNSSH